jgi:hypothetical protein
MAQRKEIKTVDYKATRGPGLHLVESQRTERHQAHTIPTIWGPVNPPISWSQAVAIIVCIVVPVAIVIAALIVTSVK